MPHLESGFGVGVVLVDHCVSLGENRLAHGVFFRRVESQVELGLLINNQTISADPCTSRR